MRWCFFILKRICKQEIFLPQVSQPPTQKRWANRRDWFDPLLLVAVFILVIALFFGMFYLNSLNNYKTELAEDSHSAMESIYLRLEGNEQYLKMLAADRALGILDEINFQEKVSQYVEDHKEFLNIAWVDTNYIILTASPLSSNKQIIGLKIILPEQKRASTQAHKTNQSVYTFLFESIKGNASFETWIPI